MRTTTRGGGIILTDAQIAQITSLLQQGAPLNFAERRRQRLSVQAIATRCKTTTYAIARYVKLEVSYQPETKRAKRMQVMHSRTIKNKGRSMVCEVCNQKYRIQVQPVTGRCIEECDCGRTNLSKGWAA